MKRIFLLVTLLFALALNAQKSESENVKATIIEFFDAFHKQDTMALKSMAKGNIKMQSIAIDNDAKTVLTENDYFQFVENIASIPKGSMFEEKLLDFKIQVDGNMANAWTPYEFWYQEKLSHCGVNSFQLIKEDDKWLILYLVDTRRREGCEK